MPTLNVRAFSPDVVMRRKKEGRCVCCGADKKTKPICAAVSMVSYMSLLSNGVVFGAV